MSNTAASRALAAGAASRAGDGERAEAVMAVSSGRAGAASPRDDIDDDAGDEVGADAGGSIQNRSRAKG